MLDVLRYIKINADKVRIPVKKTYYTSFSSAPFLSLFCLSNPVRFKNLIRMYCIPQFSKIESP